MIRTLLIWCILLLPLFMVENCSKDKNPAAASSDFTFGSGIQPIFNASCARSGCHNATAQQNLNLLQGQAFANLVNVNSEQEPGLKRVKPNDADSSYLQIKIENKQTNGTDRMPPGSALSSANIELIKKWINAGAQNN